MQDKCFLRHDKPGPRIIIQMTYLNNIGGIETACEHIARTFKDKNICFVVNALSDGAMELVERLNEYQDVVLDLDQDMTHEADVVLFFTPIMIETDISKYKARKMYQVVHSDIAGLMAYQKWQDFKWSPDARIDKVLSVSDTVQKGIKDKLNVDSIVVPNIFNPRPDRKVFLFMSRATSEKGLDKVLNLVNVFDAAGKDYVLIISSRVDPYGPLWPEIERNPRIMYVPSSIYNDVLYRCADYLVQLSTIESYCYTIREALAHGVAVIGSKIPEIQKVIKDGVNGYLFDEVMTQDDIEKIFNNVPKPKGYSEPVPAIWQDVMEGKL